MGVEGAAWARRRAETSSPQSLITGGGGVVYDAYASPYGGAAVALLSVPRLAYSSPSTTYAGSGPNPQTGTFPTQRRRGARPDLIWIVMQ